MHSDFNTLNHTIRNLVLATVVMLLPSSYAAATSNRAQNKFSSTASKSNILFIDIVNGQESNEDPQKFFSIPSNDDIQTDYQISKYTVTRKANPVKRLYLAYLIIRAPPVS